MPLNPILLKFTRLVCCSGAGTHSCLCKLMRLLILLGFFLIPFGVGKSWEQSAHASTLRQSDAVPRHLGAALMRSSDRLAVFINESEAFLAEQRPVRLGAEGSGWDEVEQRAFVSRVLAAHREGRFRELSLLLGQSPDQISRLREDRRQLTFVALASAHFRLGQFRTAARICALVDPSLHQEGLRQGGAHQPAGLRSGLSQLPAICAYAALVSANQLGGRIDPWRDYGSFLFVYLGQNETSRSSLAGSLAGALWVLRKIETTRAFSTIREDGSRGEDPLSLTVSAVSAAHFGRADWALESLSRARAALTPLLAKSRLEVTYQYGLVEWLTGRILADMGRADDARTALERSSEAMLEILQHEVASLAPRRRVLLSFGRLVFETAREIERSGDTGRALGLLVQLRDSIGLSAVRSVDGEFFVDHLQMELDLSALRLQMIGADGMTPASLMNVQKRVIDLWKESGRDLSKLQALRASVLAEGGGASVDLLAAYRSIERLAVKYGDFSFLRRNVSAAVRALQQQESVFAAAAQMSIWNDRSLVLGAQRTHYLDLLVHEGQALIGQHVENIADLAVFTQRQLRNESGDSPFTVRAWGELMKGEVGRFRRERSGSQVTLDDTELIVTLRRAGDLLTSFDAASLPETRPNSMVFAAEFESIWRTIEDTERWHSVYQRGLESTVHLHRVAHYLVRVLQEQTDRVRKLRQSRAALSIEELMTTGTHRLLNGLQFLRGALQFYIQDERSRREQKQQLTRALNTARVDFEKALESLRTVLLDDTRGIVRSAEQAILRRRSQARMYLMQCLARGLIGSDRGAADLQAELNRLDDVAEALKTSAGRGGLE
jgi:hypothetical protein